MAYSITVTIDREGVELVSDAFFSIGSSGVSVVDAQDVKDTLLNSNNWDYVDSELLETQTQTLVTLIGYFDTVNIRETEELFRKKLKEYNIHSGSVEIKIEEIQEINWYENWKSYYKPIEAGKYVVVPKWIDYDNKDKRIEIKIDPGMAFGTGEHDSTRLCLELMSELDFEGKSIIDVGTGSGILGIAAALSKSSFALLTDIDPSAVKIARENAELNNIKSNISIISADLLDCAIQKADIITANLTADLLIRLADDIDKSLNPQGYIIASGIIIERRNDVVYKYAQMNYNLIKEKASGDWVAMIFKRKDGA